MVTNQIREEFHDFDKFLSLPSSIRSSQRKQNESEIISSFREHTSLLNNIAKKLRSQGAAFFTEEKNLRGNIVISHERWKFAPK